MRAQDFVGWLVPAYVLTASVAGLVVQLLERRYSQVWMPALGLAFGALLVRGLLRRRKQWLETQARSN